VFRTLGNSLQLMRFSWRILMEHKQLALFPVMSGLALLAVCGYTGIAFWAGGTFDRIGPDYRVNVPDIAFLLLAYFMASFVSVYFNTALVAAAHYRIEGGDPDVSVGLNAANDRLGAVLGWSLITATVLLVIRQVAESNSLLGRVFGALGRGLWAFATFFVLPVLIVEGVGPVESLRRSTELVTRTWGKQLVANFGFGLGYFFVIVAAAAPLAPAYFLLGQGAAIGVGGLFTLPLLLAGMAALKAMEGIFTVALYHYAAAGGSSDFPEKMLRRAYVTKGNRGSWDGAPSSSYQVRGVA
jgi:hypothetical protein